MLPFLRGGNPARKHLSWLATMLVTGKISPNQQLESAWQGGCLEL